jgi:hypothetical protein
MPKYLGGSHLKAKESQYGYRRDRSEEWESRWGIDGLNSCILESGPRENEEDEVALG